MVDNCKLQNFKHISSLTLLDLLKTLFYFNLAIGGTLTSGIASGLSLSKSDTV